MLQQARENREGDLDYTWLNVDRSLLGWNEKIFQINSRFIFEKTLIVTRICAYSGFAKEIESNKIVSRRKLTSHELLPML